MSDTLTDYALQYYDALDAQAEDEKGPLRVFRGSLVQTYKSLKISMAHYSPIRGALTAVGSMETLRAGSKSQETCVVLHKRPERSELLTRFDLTTAPSRGTLERRIKAIESRIGELPIEDMFINIEKRLGRLEKTVEQAEQNGKEGKVSNAKSKKQVRDK